MKRLVELGDADLDERTAGVRRVAEALRPYEESAARAARVARALDDASDHRGASTAGLPRLLTWAVAALLVMAVATAAATVIRRRLAAVPGAAAPEAATDPSSVRRPIAPVTATTSPPEAPSAPTAAATTTTAAMRVGEERTTPPTPSSPRVVEQGRAVAATPGPPAAPEPAASPATRSSDSLPATGRAAVETAPAIGGAAPAPAPSPARPAAPAATKLPLDDDEPLESPLSQVAAQIAGGGSGRRVVDSPTADPDGESRPLVRAVGALRRGDPAAAAALVEQYLGAHPDGACVEEAYVLGIDAAVRRGDARGAGLAADYLRRFEGGRYARFAERARRRLSGSSTPSSPTSR